MYLDNGQETTANRYQRILTDYFTCCLLLFLFAFSSSPLCPLLRLLYILQSFRPSNHSYPTGDRRVPRPLVSLCALFCCCLTSTLFSPSARCYTRGKRPAPSATQVIIVRACRCRRYLQGNLSLSHPSHSGPDTFPFPARLLRFTWLQVAGCLAGSPCSPAPFPLDASVVCFVSPLFSFLPLLNELPPHCL